MIFFISAYFGLIWKKLKYNTGYIWNSWIFNKNIQSLYVDLISI